MYLNFFKNQKTDSILFSSVQCCWCVNELKIKVCVTGQMGVQAQHMLTLPSLFVNAMQRA